MSIFGSKKKSANYISAKEMRAISRQNRRITNEIEKKRNRKNVSESEYLTTMRDPANVVEFDNLHTYFFTDIGTVKAVDGVSFEIPQGKTVGVVGESGCGKSVTSLSLMQLVQRPQGQIVEGAIRLNLGDKAVDIAKMPTEAMQKIRGKEVSMIFQDPMTCLNPTKPVGKQIVEAIQHHRHLSKAEAKAEAIKYLSLVNIPNPEERAKQYPHEFSGGMRQRAMIAMALSCNPKLLIADEPTTALDVTIQAQIMDLLAEIKEKTSTAIILITHDLGVVASMADRVAVMYAGKVVETGTCEDIFYRNAHPYTQALLKSLPSVDMNKTQRLVSIPGTPPDLLNPPKGCGFGARCTHCMKICHEEQPPVFKVGEGHEAACWLLHPDCPSAAERGEPDEQ